MEEDVDAEDPLLMRVMIVVFKVIKWGAKGFPRSSGHFKLLFFLGKSVLM
jgi:hypothetical protein